MTKSKKLSARGKGPGYQKAIDKTYLKKNPKKKKARNKQTNAVRDGKVKKPAGKEFHHTGYGKSPKGMYLSKKAHYKKKKPKQK